VKGIFSWVRRLIICIRFVNRHRDNCRLAFVRKRVGDFWREPAAMVDTCKKPKVKTEYFAAAESNYAPGYLEAHKCGVAIGYMASSSMTPGTYGVKIGHSMPPGKYGIMVGDYSVSSARIRTARALFLPGRFVPLGTAGVLLRKKTAVGIPYYWVLLDGDPKVHVLALKDFVMDQKLSEEAL